MNHCPRVPRAGEMAQNHHKAGSLLHTGTWLLGVGSRGSRDSLRGFLVGIVEMSEM